VLDYLDTAKLKRATSSYIAKLFNGRDHGFEAFFIATCRHPSITRLKTTEDQAYYLCKQSPRMSMPLRIMDFEGAFAIPEPGKSRPRFLIICHWPAYHRMDGGDACRSSRSADSDYHCREETRGASRGYCRVHQSAVWTLGTNHHIQLWCNGAESTQQLSYCYSPGAGPEP
jgi:hypothetical protein